MTETLALYHALQDFVGFTAADAVNLRELAPLFARHGAALTDAFYARLAANPETAAIIAGRVDALKQTHATWLAQLFAGPHDERYFDDRWRIGLVHVRVGVKPWWVEAVASFLRAEGVLVIERELADPARRAACACSLLRVLDLDVMIINLAYGDERLARLSEFTGMSRKLIERCVVQRRA